ncbi:hypothetical protein [Corynebacterium testudinoris]|uniref:Uncharacterized protein n=1 Tax=Corynebacterium testudinoris TaxID=136857 RepID=A0A0G3H405_9CORY|nr:hypothetical protein [Corynebacterium testudinoris]AKK07490.1 hypothetical protein CTEST_00095 [Corynebacterium testudinoris]
MAEYQVPTEEQIQAALRRLTSFQLRRAFYEGLKNPLWVKPLADAGAFSSPPEPEVGSDGTVSEKYWPEASYLNLMAEHVPAEVAEVLGSLAGSSNSWVRRIVFSAGSRMPSAIAANLKPVIDGWKVSGYGWRTDPRDLVSFAVNLLEGGETKFGVSFANKLFRPRKDAGTDGYPVTELKAHWYSRGLPRVTRALGGSALKVILPWLTLYEEKERSIGEDYDHSGYGRFEIAQGRNNHHEVQDALIDAVRDAAVEHLEREPLAAWAALNGNSTLIVRRISLYAVAHVLGRQAAEETVNAELVSVARELMLDAKSRDQLAVSDFIRLLQALGTVSPAELDPLENVLASGHVTERAAARLKRNLCDQSESDAETQNEIAQLERHWRHRVLAGVGRELLPSILREQLDELDAEDGVVDDPLRPTLKTSGWTGPNSPMALVEMVALEPMELVSQLEGWHDKGDGWGPRPSHEGQARVLETVITSNPQALAGQRDLAHRLRPTYLRALLNGWEGAFKAELDLPWTQVLALIADILGHSDASDFPVESGRFDDDPDFTETKKVAIRFLTHLASKASDAKLSEEQLSQIANQLLAAASGTSEWSEYVGTLGEESEWDPLMVSLNWRWPILLRGLVNLVGLGEDRPWHSRAIEALSDQLALDDPRGASRAVLGEGLGRLFTHAHDWLVESLPTYFGTHLGSDRNQQVAMTTAIAMHYYHPDLYRLLSDPMIAAIESADKVAIGWGNDVSPQQRIGQWVVAAIIRGHIGEDDPLRTEFYTRADPETRGEAIGHTAWSFMHTEIVDDAIRDQLANLWDERVHHVKAHPEDKAELKDFYWFIRSERFPASWWLPRLLEALELDGELETGAVAKLGGEQRRLSFSFPNGCCVWAFSGRLEDPVDDHRVRVRLPVGKHRALPFPQ